MICRGINDGKIEGMWQVIYSNYFPREVESYWATKEEAEAQRDKLNDEDPLGSSMWEMECQQHCTDKCGCELTGNDLKRAREWATEYNA